MDEINVLTAISSGGVTLLALYIMERFWKRIIDLENQLAACQESRITDLKQILMHRPGQYANFDAPG